MLRSFLANPFGYRLFRSLVAGSGARLFVRDYVRPAADDRILDIGCGPGVLLDYLPATVGYVGFDVSEAYIAAARARYGDRGVFHHRRVGGDALDEAGSFDLVLAIGVLHHLDDAEARDLMALARSALRDGGRLVTLDGCFRSGQSRASRLVVSMDRGRHIRQPEQYRALAAASFAEVRLELRDDLIRIPYSHVVLDCLA